MALLGISLFAQNANISFKDNSTTTLLLVRLEDPNYPITTPVGSRWVMRAYLSTDNVIDPLGIDGNPTNDDTYLQDINLIFGPNGYLGISAAVVPALQIPKYLYLRIFNSTVFANATKYMTFFAPYYVGGPGPVNVNIMPNYGWKTNPVWSPIFPVTDTWTYNLAISASDNGAYEFTDPLGGVHTTPATLTMDLVMKKTDFWEHIL